MSDFSASDVAFTGIRFVRHNPRAVAVWAAIQVVLSLVTGTMVVATMGPALTQMQALGVRPADPAQAVALLQRILPFYAVIMPISLVLYAVIYSTMNRAVLRPAESRFGYLRLGMDEARQFLLILLWVVAWIVIYIVAILAMTVLGLVGLMMGPTGAVATSLLGGLLDIAVVIYVAVRLSLASAQTFDRGRIDFFGSWALTKGRFWKVFGSYFLAFAVAVVISILVMVITAAATGILAGMALMFRPNMSSLGAYFAPAQLATLVIWGLAMPLLWSLMLMPGAGIYRHLSGAADPALDPSTFD